MCASTNRRFRSLRKSRNEPFYLRSAEVSAFPLRSNAETPLKHRPSTLSLVGARGWFWIPAFAE
ncbi:MAG: hypothetical protein A2Z18_05440 [Armatimonadetes bacterium RBG_16_58_9]|nr:MAG: hypothetical protein A2Z18_05440 [Armatimonadetes bacterium RBG_16_58_9]